MLVLSLHTKNMAETLTELLRTHTHFKVCEAATPSAMKTIALAQRAEVVLAEVTPTPPYDFDTLLAARSSLRAEGIPCKFMVILNDQDYGIADKTVRAKRRGLIDGFVYWNGSLDYLADAVDVL